MREKLCRETRRKIGKLENSCMGGVLQYVKTMKIKIGLYWLGIENVEIILLEALAKLGQDMMILSCFE